MLSSRAQCTPESPTCISLPRVLWKTHHLCCNCGQPCQPGVVWKSFSWFSFDVMYTCTEQYKTIANGVLWWFKWSYWRVLSVDIAVILVIAKLQLQPREEPKLLEYWCVTSDIATLHMTWFCVATSMGIFYAVLGNSVNTAAEIITLLSTKLRSSLVKLVLRFNFCIRWFARNLCAPSHRVKDA